MFVGAAGVPVIAETDVPATAVSVTATGPAGNVNAVPHVPLGAAPAATVCVCPPAVNVKLVPAVTPVPAILQITSVPVVGAATFVNVIRDSCPAVIWVVADPPARLMFVGAGVPVMLCTTVPATAVSVTVAAPAPSVSAVPHVPFGAAPAATVEVKPPAVKVKFVPAVTPVPPTLQITSVPVGPWLVNVSDVVPMPTMTVARPPGRSDVPCCAPAGDTTMPVDVHACLRRFVHLDGRPDAEVASGGRRFRSDPRRPQR